MSDDKLLGFPIVHVDGVHYRDMGIRFGDFSEYIDPDFQRIINTLKVGDIMDVELGYGYYAKVKVASIKLDSIVLEGIGEPKRHGRMSRVFRSFYNILREFWSRYARKQ